MKTIKINMEYQCPELKLSGLSFKALKGTDVEKRIFRDDGLGTYCLETQFYINGITAKIELGYLIISLQQIRSKIWFDKIEIIGHYEKTGEQLLDLIK